MRWSPEQAEAVVEDLEKDLDLIDPSLIAWNKDYYEDRSRYIGHLYIVTQYYKDGEILEIGSMPCHFTYCLKRLGYPVIGVDIAPERAKAFIEKHGLQVHRCDVELEPLPFEDNRFGFVLFSEILEHLRINPIHALREAHRVLRDGGLLMVGTPNLYALGRILSFLRGRGLNNPYTEFQELETVGHMGHIREYSSREVRQFLENTGFEVVATKYAIYGRRTKSLGRMLLNAACYLWPRFRPYQVVMARKRAGNEHEGRNSC